MNPVQREHNNPALELQQVEQHSASDEFTTLIIGAGVLGLSLLRHMTTTRPADKVIAFDSYEKPSAINDTHKIIRKLYPSKSRTETATEAQKAWSADPILRLFYHTIGRIEITDDVVKLDAIDAISRPRKRLDEQSINDHIRACNPSSKEYRSLEFALRLLRTAEDPNLQCVWNEDNAVVDWNSCIQEVRRPLQSRIRDVKVERLVVGDTGRICRLVLRGGEIVTIADGDKIIMTPGAWGERLLKDSNINAPPKASQAVGVFTFHLRPNELHRQFLKDLPALSFQTADINCEFLPPLTKTGLAKIGLTLPFTNERNEPQDISETPLMYYALLTVIRWAHKYYPELEGAEIVAKEVHWDGVTEDQTPLISWHPEHGNLAVGWGASYTRAKDLPIVGRMIHEVLFQGNVSEEYAWLSTPNEDKIQHHQPLLLTKKLFTDLNEEAAMNEEVQIFMKHGNFKHL